LTLGVEGLIDRTARAYVEMQQRLITRVRVTGRAFAAALLFLFLSAPTARAEYPPAYEAEPPSPSAGWKAYDAMILRPFGLAQTLVGAAVFVPFYPLAAVADEIVTTDAKSWVTEACITGPVYQTFQKPLGEL
jgi:hypothetical protein